MTSGLGESGKSCERAIWRRVPVGVAVVVIGLAGLAGCVNRTDPALVNTASYQGGYADGCTTGNQRRDGFTGTIKRNEALFKTDEAYQAGWRAGYGACGDNPGELRPGKTDFLSDDRFDQGPI